VVTGGDQVGAGQEGRRDQWADEHGD
jgi:hypothetical protein